MTLPAPEVQGMHEKARIMGLAAQNYVRMIGPTAGVLIITDPPSIKDPGIRTRRPFGDGLTAQLKTNQIPVGKIDIPVYATKEQIAEAVLTASKNLLRDKKTKDFTVVHLGSSSINRDGIGSALKQLVENDVQVSLADSSDATEGDIELMSWMTETYKAAIRQRTEQLVAHFESHPQGSIAIETVNPSGRAHTLTLPYDMQHAAAVVHSGTQRSDHHYEGVRDLDILEPLRSNVSLAPFSFGDSNGTFVTASGAEVDVRDGYVISIRPPQGVSEMTGNDQQCKEILDRIKTTDNTSLTRHQTIPVAAVNIGTFQPSSNRKIPEKATLFSGTELGIHISLGKSVSPTEQAEAINDIAEAIKVDHMSLQIKPDASLKFNLRR